MEEDPRIERIREIGELRVNQLSNLFEQLCNHFQSLVNAEIGRVFIEILNILQKIVSSLQTINVTCVSLFGEICEVKPGALTYDLDLLDFNQKFIQRRIDTFRSLSLSLSEPVNQYQLKFVIDINQIVFGNEIQEICLTRHNFQVERLGFLSGSSLVQIQGTLAIFNRRIADTNKSVKNLYLILKTKVLLSLKYLFHNVNFLLKIVSHKVMDSLSTEAEEFEVVQQANLPISNSSNEVQFKTEEKDELLTMMEQIKEEHEKMRIAMENHRKRFLEDMEEIESEGLRKLKIERANQDTKLEELKNNLQVDLLEKDTSNNLQLELLTKDAEENQKSDSLKLELKNKELENSISQLNSEIEHHQIKHESEMKELQEEVVSDNMALEQELSKIREESTQKLEESANKWEERERLLKEQADRILQVLKMRVWNQIVENNWSNRLNFLRSANNEVERCFFVFQKEVKHISNRKQNFRQDRIGMKKLTIYLDAVLAALKSEIALMRTEIENQEVMYSNTGKPFLKSIIHSLETILSACLKFENQLKQFQSTFVRHSDQHSDGNDIAMDLQISFELLKHTFEMVKCHSLQIPTLAELKKKYEEDMKNQEEDKGDEEDVTNSQTVIIEEVE